jgi:prolyl 4-hydroxylase
MQHQIVIPGKGRPYLDGDSIDHGAALVVTVPAVLGAAECAAMIARIEDLGPAAAPVTTDRGFAMMPDVRNNERVMFDDVALAAELYVRLHDALPEQLSEMRKVGINERFRCYRYAPGQRFAPHQDGAFRRSADEHSQLTLMVYLNAGFGGGTTHFLDFEREVVPRTGDALLFQHRLWHEGSVVTSGTKCVLRSDVMYRR